MEFPLPQKEPLWPPHTKLMELLREPREPSLVDQIGLNFFKLFSKPRLKFLNLGLNKI